MILFAPLLSLFIFMLGNGFFQTLLALKMNLNHQPTLLIGAMSSVFYAGIVIGAFRIEKVILNVGHIRAYAGFASVLATMNMLSGMISHDLILLLLRLIAGFATAGVFVVLESWLLSGSSVKNRGQILALYMISFYLAQALGQYFLYLDKPTSLSLFAICSMSSSLSILPLTLVKVSSPEFEEPSALGLKKLYRNAASGLVGCFSSGLIMGAIFGLLPLFFAHVLGHKSEVAFYMSVLIFGGMLLQYPMGKLSDVIERRLVLIIISVAGIFALLLSYALVNNAVLFVIATAVLGGLTFTLYPVSISHACDALDNKDIVAGTQSLLLAYSVGAMIGPFIAPFFMSWLGLWGLYFYLGCVCLSLLPILVWRKTHKENTEQEESFSPMPQTSPIMSEIDPRSDK